MSSMPSILLPLVCALGLLPAVEVSGPQRLAVEDLASDSAWTLAVDDGPVRAIKVPGGGYNSDRQDQPWIDQEGVKDHVVYRRAITIPGIAERQVTVVEFGAVNCGADIALIDGDQVKPVTSHVGTMMPFTADLTPLVTPGRTYTLQVTSYPARHYGNRTPRGFHYPEAWTHPDKGWSSRNAAGITKWVRLAVYPGLRISEVFVRPSVTRAGLGCTVRVRNHAAVPRTVTINGGLSSWNRATWTYPSIPPVSATVPADGEACIELPAIPWTLGPASWWWPNKPFREDFQAQLHWLDLSLGEGATVAHRWRQRFGFVEWSEGPFFYRVNGVRINHLGDGTPEAAMNEHDCYSVAPAFLPPTRPGTGFPETVRRYQRMGICTNRIHQSTPTPYMMDVADELGFMLIPETAIRCNQEVWDDVLIPQTVQELARACRNHPSTCRYSLLNETHPAWVGPLADAIATIDPTRPLVFEDDQQKKVGAIFGRNGTHAYCMLHYQPHPQQAQMICGVGECAWANAGPTGNGVEDFAIRALDGRCQDIAYYAGWDWINYWPNFLEGMDAQHHAWKQKDCCHEDRSDGVDGWNSPVMRWVQRCFHPHLVLDRDFYLGNGAFTAAWPKRVPVAAPGEDLVRTLVVFNDVVHGGRTVSVRWTARWDAADGPVAVQGLMADIPVEPGFHVERRLVLPAPATAAKRTLFLVLESLVDGQRVFSDDQVRFVIDPLRTVAQAAFVGQDDATAGTWPGRYGAVGRACPGHDAVLPADVRLTWQDGTLHTWADATGDVRALCLDERQDGGRSATAHHGAAPSLTVALGDTPRRLSVYCVDWEGQGRRQELVISDATVDRELDRRPLADFRKGRWLTWTVSGTVRITARHGQGGHNAVISGVFIDAVK